MYWKKMKHYDGHVFLMSKKNNCGRDGRATNNMPKSN